MEHNWLFCNHCQVESVVCAKCWTPTCYGHAGQIEEEDCEECANAQAVYAAGKP